MLLKRDQSRLQGQSDTQGTEFCPAVTAWQVPPADAEVVELVDTYV